MGNKICVFGDAFVDLVVPVDNIVPDGSKPENIFLSYGGTANVSVWLSRLGVRSSFIGKVGDDSLGRSFRDNLKREKVEDMTVFDDKFQTGICISLVKNDGSRTMITNRGANDNLRIDDLCKCHYRAIEEAEILYFSGYSLISDKTSKAVKHLLEKSKDVVREIWFNPGAHNIISEMQIKMIKKYCNGIILNLDEGKILCSEDKIEDIVRKLKSLVNIVILTLGERGCIAMNDYHYLRVPAKKVEMVTDTTGAGDAFAAGFLANRLRQKSVKDCCSLGHEVASTVIQKYGAR